MNAIARQLMIPATVLAVISATTIFAAGKGGAPEADHAGAPAAEASKRHAPGGLKGMIQFWQNDGLAEDLKLSKEQTDQLEANFDAKKDDVRKAQHKVRDARNKLSDAMEESKPDAKAVDSAIDELSAAKAESMKASIGYRLAVKEILTEDQQEQLKDSRRERFRHVVRERFRERFDGGAPFAQGMEGGPDDESAPPPMMHRGEGGPEGEQMDDESPAPRRERGIRRGNRGRGRGPGANFAPSPLPGAPAPPEFAEMPEMPAPPAPPDAYDEEGDEDMEFGPI